MSGLLVGPAELIRRGGTMRRAMAWMAAAVLVPGLAWATPREAAERAQQEAEQYLRPCLASGAQDQRSCEFNRAEFLRDYQLAKRGDYQAQRNVAFSLSGAMRPTDRLPYIPNALQACAWRHVILLSGHARAGEDDVAAMRRNCGSVGSDAAGAYARAERLLAEIRSDPPAPPPPRPALPPHRGPLNGDLPRLPGS